MALSGLVIAADSQSVNKRGHPRKFRETSIYVHDANTSVYNRLELDCCVVGRGREPEPVFLLRVLVGRCCSFALILFCWRSLDIQNFENSRLKTSSLHSTRPALAHLSARFSQSASPLSILIVDLETGLAESSLRCVANTTPSSCKGVKSTRELNKEKVKIGVFGLSDPHFPVSPSLRGCRPAST